MKKIFVSLVFCLICSAMMFAQTREPSTATRPFTVKTKQSVADLEKSLHTIDKDLKTKETVSKSEDLIGGEGMQLRVAIQYDAKKSTALAELHDESDDVYYVLEGSAQLTLGGKLDNPKEQSAGEWRSEKIVGGTTFTLKKGDLIIVPRGTPHHRINTKGKTFSLILIKIFKEPLKSAK